MCRVSLLERERERGERGEERKREKEERKREKEERKRRERRERREQIFVFYLPRISIRNCTICVYYYVLLNYEHPITVLITANYNYG